VIVIDTPHGLTSHHPVGHTVIVEGAGHFVQSDAPDRFAPAIRDWHTAPAAGGTRVDPHGTETHVLRDGRT
jgi:hypothetical protein